MKMQKTALPSDAAVVAAVEAVENTPLVSNVPLYVEPLYIELYYDGGTFLFKFPHRNIESTIKEVLDSGADYFIVCRPYHYCCPFDVNQRGQTLYLPTEYDRPGAERSFEVVTNPINCIPKDGQEIEFDFGTAHFSVDESTGKLIANLTDASGYNDEPTLEVVFSDLLNEFPYVEFCKISTGKYEVVRLNRQTRTERRVFRLLGDSIWVRTK
jgi:hypothetical protein